jgi:hypothetical protein
MNIPFGVSNFFIGRVFEPEVVMTQVNRNLINLKLSASPILIPMLRAELPASGAPSQIRRLYKPLTIDCPDGVNKQCSIQTTSISGANKGKEAFEKFSLFEPFLGDRASKMIPMWSFQNYPANTKRCHPFGSFKGLVSTNAAIYDGEPPKLIDGELVYKVAGTHHDASGNVFSGTYDLILQSQVARCYYGLNKNPIQASVSIESRSGEKKIKTVSLREKDGYIRLSVGGFTFSQPTIKVVFSQAPASTPSPTATSSSSTSDSVTSIKDSHSVITCIKGGKTKKVSGVKPKCPKGFKKR